MGTNPPTLYSIGLHPLHALHLCVSLFSPLFLPRSYCNGCRGTQFGTTLLADCAFGSDFRLERLLTQEQQSGSKRGYLENADLFTVSFLVITPLLLTSLIWTQLNTSMLGRTTLDTSKTSSPILKSIKNTISKDVNEVISDVAKTLNIHDFYSAHILDYCEVSPKLSSLSPNIRLRLTILRQQGFYTPSPTANLTSQPSKNVTYCSNETSFFHFDPAAVVQNELKPGVKLTDLKWPSAIQDGVHAVKDATSFMFLLYFIGAATTGVALIAALIAVRAVWRYSAIACLMLSSVCQSHVLLEAMTWLSVWSLT